MDVAAILWAKVTLGHGKLFSFFLWCQGTKLKNLRPLFGIEL